MSTDQEVNPDFSAELETLKYHVKNEMAVLRLVLQSPDLPERVRAELQASLIRMARMV